MVGALQGLRIIEVSQVLAAPFCGYQFALLGADVIKVESPRTPDCARGRGPVPALNAREVGLTYQVQGANKRSLALDLTDPRGVAALHKLVGTADVFIENYSTGTLDALNLGYDTLRAVNPRLIHCSMTGYGETGPKARKGAYDNTIQAASGIISQSAGQKPGVSFVDYAAGYAAAFAIAAAVVQRHRTGEGCHISASMLDVAMSLMAPEAAAIQVAPAAPKRDEAGIATYETATGPLMLGAFKPAQYRKLGRCLARAGYSVPNLEEIRDWPDVWANSAVIRVTLEAIFRQRGAEEWVGMLDSADVPAERIVTLAEAVASRQLAERGYFTESPDDPSIRLPVAGYTMSRGGPEVTMAPPELGAHSRAVLMEAGLSGSEIDALIAAEVVR